MGLEWWIGLRRYCGDLISNGISCYFWPVPKVTKKTRLWKIDSVFCSNESQIQGLLILIQYRPTPLETGEFVIFSFSHSHLFLSISQDLFELTLPSCKKQPFGRQALSHISILRSERGEAFKLCFALRKSHFVYLISWIEYRFTSYIKCLEKRL